MWQQAGSPLYKLKFTIFPRSCTTCFKFGNVFSFTIVRGSHVVRLKCVLDKDRQKQKKPSQFGRTQQLLWKERKGLEGRQRLLQEQGNKEQSLMCCLARQFPTRKQIQEETRAQILETQNILPKLTASDSELQARASPRTPDSLSPWTLPLRQLPPQCTHPWFCSSPFGFKNRLCSLQTAHFWT